jgi:hypothetical protein
MSGWLTLSIAVVYLYAAAEHLWRGNHGFALMFLGFSIGNVGMYYASR